VPLLLGLLAAALALGLYLGVEKVGPPAIPLALLRAAAWGSVAVLLLNPACARVREAGVTVLLDHSRSMSDPDSDTRWRAALDTARVLAGRRGTVLLFGEEVRPLSGAIVPDAPASRLLPALREAAARGGPVAIVTDGEVDDRVALPDDLLRRSRVVLLPRPARRDAAVSTVELPAALRAGDTAVAVIRVVASGAEPRDSADIVLRDGARVLACSRISLGPGGGGRELRFVPPEPRGDSETKIYEARVEWPVDRDRRNDARRLAALVTRASSIVLLSDSPDWDSRWLTSTLATTAGVPVRVYLRLGQGGWRDGHLLRPAKMSTVEAAARRAALLIAHGTTAGVEEASRLARRALMRWPIGGDAGDWYVTGAGNVSPLATALGGVSVESLPPLAAVARPESDSTAWTALTALRDRRGQPRTVITGQAGSARRVAEVHGSGFWRWAAKGGVAAEAYRALVAGLTDWLLEVRPPEVSRLEALRDSLRRGASELIPRSRTLEGQPGNAAGSAAGPAPVRHFPWVYFAALAALLAEWVARRRMGLR
jgi:hypothetical protein